MKAKITEIFRSIQGEGKFLGVMQVFVRFYECNINCMWCDTPTSINDISADVQDLSVSEVADKIKVLSKDCHSISFTGGEPLIQKEFLKELFSALKKAGQNIYLETNGILFKNLDDILCDVDVVAMDFKLPSSTGERAYWSEHAEFLRKCLDKDVFVKTVITSKTTRDDIENAVDIISKIDPCTTLILQPETSELNNKSVEKCIEFQALCMQEFNDVRIIPQVHKFMEVK